MSSHRLAADIQAAVEGKDPCLWLPSLTDRIVSFGEGELQQEHGLTRPSYSAGKVVFGARPGANSELLLSACEFPVELPTLQFREIYQQGEFEFFAGLDVEEPVSLLKRAVSLLKLVPSMFASVSNLVWTIHLLSSRKDEYDVSFSEPKIPFSIFVSIPSPNAESPALRVAESVIHEAMHLQLSLIERIMPLFRSHFEGQFYSPWRKEFRTPSGIIHAVYVFAVIDQFYKQHDWGEQARFAVRRQAEIESQIASLSDFEDGDLTPIGSTLVKRILSSSS